MGTGNAERLRTAVKSALAPLADAAKAQPMRAYMRDQFEYLGIQTPQLRRAVLPVFRLFDTADAAELLAAVRAVWGLREREYQYAALDLLAYRERLLGVKDLPAVLELVQEKSWWDTVDRLAGIVGTVVRRDKKAGGRVMDRAVRSGNMWVRRVAMVHQLLWRGDTDVARLFAYAECLAHEQEFFIRKAIGWALRDYAKHDRGAVESFVEMRRDRLSSLTCREAMKRRGSPGDP